METSAAEQLAIYLYSKLMSPKIGSFIIVDILPNTVTIDEDGLSNTVSIDRVTFRTTLVTVQNVKDNAHNGNKGGLQTDAISQKVNTSCAMQQNVVLDNEKSKEVATPKSPTRKNATWNGITKPTTQKGRNIHVQ